MKPRNLNYEVSLSHRQQPPPVVSRTIEHMLQGSHSTGQLQQLQQERTQLRRMIESNSVYSGIGKGIRRTSMFKNGSGEGGVASSSSPGHRQVGSGSALLKATSSNQNNIV